MGKTKYTHEPMGKVKAVPDFLPSPAELALMDETVNGISVQHSGKLTMRCSAWLRLKFISSGI